MSDSRDPVISCEQYEELIIAMMGGDASEDDIASAFSHQTACASGRHRVEDPTLVRVRRWTDDERAETNGLTFETAGRAAVNGNGNVRRVEGQLGQRQLEILGLGNGLSSSAPPHAEGSCEILVRADDASRLLKQLDRDGVRQRAHVRFVRGCRLGYFYQFGRAGGTQGWSAIRDAFVRTYAAKLRPAKVDFIVAHTEWMYSLCRDLAIASGIDPTHVLLALGGDFPFVVSWPGECQGKRVALFVDVVVSGTCVEKLRGFIEERLKASVVVAGALVSQLLTEPPSERLLALLADEADDYAVLCARCMSGEDPSYYDHPTGMLYPKPTTRDLTVRWRSNLNEHAPMWSRLARTGALRRSVELEGNVYDFFVDTMRLLKDATVREEIRTDMRRKLEAIASKPHVVVYRASRNTRPRAVAKLVSETYGWPTVAIRKSSRSGMAVPTVAELAGKNVLVVDGAINSGTSLKAVVSVVRQCAPSSITAFVILSRLHDGALEAGIDSVLDEPLMYLFPLPFRSIKSEIGKGDAFKEALRVLSQNPEWHDLCVKKLERVRWGRTKTERVMAAEVERFRLLCRPAAESRPEEVFATDLAPEQMRKLLRNIPKEWGTVPYVKQALCALVQNGVPNNVLEDVCVYLVNSGCYEWIREGWFTNHARVLHDDSKTWATLGMAMWGATRGNSSLRQEVKAELQALVETERGGQAVLRFSGAQGPTTVARERLDALLRLIEVS